MNLILSQVSKNALRNTALGGQVRDLFALEESEASASYKVFRKPIVFNKYYIAFSWNLT